MVALVDGYDRSWSTRATIKDRPYAFVQECTMSDYVTPGLYLETTDNIATLGDIDHVDVAAFIGIARKGQPHTPIKVDSMAHFQATFGGFIPHSYLAYTVKAFFENGGTSCYIVRVTVQDGG